MSSPGVVFSSKFVSAKNKAFQGYIDYISRENAVRNKHMEKFNTVEFDGYNHYMNNPEKTSGIFTAKHYGLQKKEKFLLKEQFKQAQKNDSVMWQDVISFDNKWLEKYGMYDSKTGHLASGKLMDSVRLGMSRILEKEKMAHSAIWSAAIHYNTDNIHVHVAIVEPEPTRSYQEFTDKETGEKYLARRGLRSVGYLDEFKSIVANHLVNRDKELAKVHDLLRNKIGSKEAFIRSLPDSELLEKYHLIHAQLPKDLRQWKYNMNVLNDVRPQIDEFTNQYIQKYHSAEMKEFERLLDKENDYRKEMYGTGDVNFQRFKDTKENKMDELYARLGNTLLQDMKEFELENRINKKSFGQKVKFEGEYLGDKKPTKMNLYSLKRALSKDFNDKVRNHLAYLQLINKRENEREESL
ncbi:MAG: relaxase MobL [Streptococcaceae bacterium]|jgi:hypothetical protein|nr:relaxase MobL [Streptococcaceae bacterium]